MSHKGLVALDDLGGGARNALPPIIMPREA
jgi:hypothetical protein